MTIKLPNDFGVDTRRKADNCPYVLDNQATGCTLKPGDVVIGRDVPGLEESFGFDRALQKPRTVRMVLFGFTRPHGYACCLDRTSEWWIVHPEALRAP